MKEPTRITNYSRTLIDYVLTEINLCNRIDVKIDCDNKISDHETIKIEINNIKGLKIKNKKCRICIQILEGYI